MYYLLPTTKKMKKISKFISESVSRCYIYYFIRYMINLKFIFYESLQTQY
jgi:hypothetical protein